MREFINDRRYMIIRFLIFSLAAFLIWLGYGQAWTGFDGKTLWDWLKLLIIPVVLSVGVTLLKRSEREVEREIEDRRARTDRHIAEERELEFALQTYLDKMTELMLQWKLRTSEAHAEAKHIGRVRTLTLLRRLDGKRKGVVLRFLSEADLISNQATMVSLEGAELIECDVTNADITKATRGFDLTNLLPKKSSVVGELFGTVNEWIYRRSVTNATEENVFKAQLYGAVLRKVNLSKTVLAHSKFIWADLRETNFIDTDLSNADFEGADLTRVDFRGARLNGSNLCGANLTGAKISESQLRAARSLADATMIDGGIYDGHLNLSGDIARANTQGIDTTDKSAMARWYAATKKNN